MIKKEERIMINAELIQNNKNGEVNKNIKVLMYHRVLWEKPEEEVKWHYVTATEFENHMKWLDRFGYTTITFTDYLLYQLGDLSLPKKPIIITFDDGYHDTFENAIPIMLKYNMRGVIFVMGNRSMRRANWDDPEIENDCLLMNDDQIRMAESFGFEIGAHSMNHLDLISINDEDLGHEIMWSKFQIEQILGKPIYSFAYPYGRVDERVQMAALEAGFRFACGVYTGPAWFGENNFDIRRIAIGDEIGSLTFLLRVLTPFEYVEWSYAKIKDTTLTRDRKKPSLDNSRKNGKLVKDGLQQKPEVLVN